MVTGRPRLLPPARRLSPALRRAAIAAAILLHAAALATLLLRPGPARLPRSEAPLEIELIEQPAETKGAQPPPAPQPAPKPADKTPPSPAAQPNPAAPSGRDDLPAAAAPSAPAAAASPAPKQQSAPEINLGNGFRDVDPLSVTGDNVVPPKPDARYRNAPPRYPPAAARIGAEGVAQVVAHVAPNGQPVSVGIVTSSGNADLDEEAQRAVMGWHFQPARSGKRAVPFDYVINIRFTLGNR